MIDGVDFINTTSGKWKGREGAATFEIGDWGVSNLGHLRKDGTIALTGDWSAGGFKITNLAAPVAVADAARLQEVNAKLSKGGVQGDRTLDAGNVLRYQGAITLIDNLDLVHKSYCDLKILKTGDAGISGRLAYSATFGSSAIADILRKDEIQNLTTFNTSTGHDHNGTNSKRVIATNLSTSGATANQQTLKANTVTGLAEWKNVQTPAFHFGPALFTHTGMSSNITFTTVDASAFVASTTSILVVKLIVTLSSLIRVAASAVNFKIDVDFRMFGDSTITRYTFEIGDVGTNGEPRKTDSLTAFVPVDFAGKRFQYAVTRTFSNTNTANYSIDGTLVAEL